MARYPVYSLAIGATLCLYLEAVEGDPTLVTPVVAAIKPVASEGADVPAESVPAVGAAIITAQSLSPGVNIDGTAIGPGFEVTIDAAVSATLAPGLYLMDLAFAVGGLPFVTSPVMIRAVNAVSLGAGA